jgi:hypothetical protein
MRIYQLNKSRMYLATNKVLEDHRALYAGIDEMVNIQVRLNDYLTLIGNYRQVQESNQTGITNNKALLKTQLTTKTLRVIAALAAHATSVKDMVLLGRISYSPSALRKPDPLLVDVAKLILNEARNLGGMLDKYFVTAADIDELENLIQQFRNAIPQRRVATNLSKVSTFNIAAVFTETDKMLRNDADVLMKPFLFTHPDFYYAYKNARMVINYTGKKKIQEESASEATQS